MDHGRIVEENTPQSSSIILLNRGSEIFCLKSCIEALDVRPVTAGAILPGNIFTVDGYVESSAFNASALD